MRFAMLITATPDDWAEDHKLRTPEAMQEVIDWFTTWDEAGKLGDGGADLQIRTRPAPSAAVVAGRSSPTAHTSNSRRSSAASSSSTSRTWMRP